MVRKYLKFMSGIMISIVLCEKVVTSDDNQLHENNNNQLVVYQLDLRPSERYGGISYDMNKQETDEERYLYYAMVSSVFRNRLQNNITASQIAERNLLFIAIPETISSASGLSAIQEVDDAATDSQRSSISDLWSINNNDEAIFYHDNVDSLCNSIAQIRASSSLIIFPELSQSSIYFDEID